MLNYCRGGSQKLGNQRAKLSGADMRSPPLHMAGEGSERPREGGGQSGDLQESSSVWTPHPRAVRGPSSVTAPPVIGLVSGRPSPLRPLCSASVPPSLWPGDSVLWAGGLPALGASDPRPLFVPFYLTASCTTAPRPNKQTAPKQIPRPVLPEGAEP